eukprot:jgi/Ulvmu1/12881/UM098_0069.1
MRCRGSRMRATLEFGLEHSEQVFWCTFVMPAHKFVVWVSYQLPKPRSAIQRPRNQVTTECTHAGARDITMQLRDGLQVIGPAFLVAVAYLDPGNWATAIESGSRFGYDQLWILVLSNVIAIHLQALSSRLGLASGKHLAQVCRDSYPPAICRLLWLMTEASIVALDLTMVLGTAIGLNLLFKIPPVTCILLTALDALALFLLFPQTALRQAEQWTAVLVFSVLACFVIDLFISKPPIGSVLAGLSPTLHRDDIYSAVSLLGANVMPHNFYLHSALVAGQSSRNDKVTARRCYLNSLDIACALGLALLVNVAVLLVAASTFHSAGDLMDSLSSRACKSLNCCRMPQCRAMSAYYKCSCLPSK